MHRPRRGHHHRRCPGLIEHEIPGLEVAHRPPTRRGRDRRIQGESLTLQSRHEVIRQLDPLERLAEDELTGMEDERLVVLDPEQLGQVGLGRADVDVRVAVVAEDPEAAVEVEVDRRRLEVGRVVRVDPDVAGLDRRPDVPVRQDAHRSPRRLVERVDLALEVLEVLEALVDAGEPDVGDLVDAAERLHRHRPDP